MNAPHDHGSRCSLQEEEACGPNLEYSDDMLRLQSALTVRQQAQFGDYVVPARAPDWPLVRELAQGLALQTRDLRVAVAQMRAATHLSGLTGYVEGLELLGCMLESHWAAVHPRLVNALDDQPELPRRSALSELDEPITGLEDLCSIKWGATGAARIRALWSSDEPGSYTGRQSIDGEADRSGFAADVARDLLEHEKDAPGTLAQLTRLETCLQDLERSWGRATPHSQPLMLPRARAIANALGRAAQFAMGAAEFAPPHRAAPNSSGEGDAGPGSADALRALSAARIWLRQIELNAAETESIPGAGARKVPVQQREPNRT